LRKRLHTYIAAGADCVFVPGVTDEETLRRFVETLDFPLNVLVAAGTPPIARLQELGVARVSVGSGLARAATGMANRIAQELKTTGSYDTMLQVAIPYSLSRLFEA
jgi:2-methylisocitrate lyase-like PEP mutase family enzyme